MSAEMEKLAVLAVFATLMLVVNLKAGGGVSGAALKVITYFGLLAALVAAGWLTYRVVLP